MVCCCRRRVLDGTNDGVNETVHGRQWRSDNVKTVSGRRQIAVWRIMVVCVMDVASLAAFLYQS